MTRSEELQNRLDNYRSMASTALRVVAAVLLLVVTVQLVQNPLGSSSQQNSYASATADPQVFTMDWLMSGSGMPYYSSVNPVGITVVEDYTTYDQYHAYLDGLTPNDSFMIALISDPSDLSTMMLLDDNGFANSLGQADIDWNSPAYDNNGNPYPGVYYIVVLDKRTMRMQSTTVYGPMK